MHVLAVLASRPAEWDRDRFLQWWSGPHADLTRRLPGLLEYRCGAAERDLDRAELKWDGYVRLGFASREALDAALASDEWQALVADAETLPGGRRVALVCAERDLYKG